ncbi:MAG: 5-deoxy-glucuronate isomerase [Propionibacteriaceae bacterium]|jgi:5-deoxy-glucuronate isomerase|nr:5-deoxy-glucuronate isomerase [Propionibacteriaceae bacterium]
MTASRWHHLAGSLASDGWDVRTRRAATGLRHTGLRVGTLQDGPGLTLEGDDQERIVVPLAGSCTVRTARGLVFELRGRPDVFSGPTDTLYLGARTAATITGHGQVAVVEAAARAARPPLLTLAEDTAVELRGAGNASRQVHNFGTPAKLDAERIIACEVLTPSGNWSSYPPHKHDSERPGQETELEEIYYFLARPVTGARPGRAVDPHGYQRVFASDDRPIDVLAEVRSGDLVVVPHGWHGPSMAAPGYDLYYLNVMAGPGPVRDWLITDHPAHAWMRDAWKNQAIDPRLPFATRP